MGSPRARAPVPLLNSAVKGSVNEGTRKGILDVPQLSEWWRSVKGGVNEGTRKGMPLLYTNAPGKPSSRVEHPLRIIIGPYGGAGSLLIYSDGSKIALTYRSF